jgi:hypothetical protein
MFTEHIEFNTPLDETVIWRYMDLWKFKDLILTKELYFPRIDQLGDLTEGIFPEESQNMLFKFLEDNGRQDEAQGLKGGFNNQRHRLDKFISSWNISDNESFLLWKAYTSDVNAVAIKSTVGSLKLALSEEPNIDNYIGSVNYHNISNYKFNGNMFSLVNQKFDYYKGENELRTVSTLPLAGSNIDDQPLYMRIKIDPEILIDKVYLSPKATQQHKVFIEKYLIDNGLSKNVFVSGINDKWLYS